MIFFHSCLFLWVNSVTTSVAEYKRCFEEFSLCLMANTADDTNVRLNQFEADKWCTEHSSSLAIITNETVQSAIKAFVDDDDAELESDIITNGYRYKTDPWMWTDGRPSGTYRNSTTNSNYNYAFLVGSNYGSPYASFFGQATSKRKFICSFLRHNYSCQRDHLQLGRRCYKIHVQEVSWFEARSICLRQNGRDLANFDHTHNISSFETEWGHYWIGLRRELWLWWSDRTIKDIKEYSNWDVGNPGLLEGNCLCLRTTTGKWRDCDCKQQYRYICIQDYASGSASIVATSSTKSTTKTTETTITTTKMTTTTTRLKTTQSTTTTIATVGDSSFQFISTSTQTLDDNSRTKMSDDPPDTLGLLPAVGIGIACLLVLIFAIAVVAIIKTRRSRSGYPGRSQGNSAPPTISKDDTPSTVYAMVVPNANEAVRSPLEKAPNQTVYAELDLVTREKTPGRVVGLPESEYSNSLHVNSVYANIDQTEV